MATMSCYVDASGSLSELAIAPAAMISTPEKWLAFEEEWNACLEAYKVSELHMKHFAHSVGEYADWKSDPLKRKRFLNKLMWIIEQYIDYTATEAIYVQAYSDIDAKYQISEFMRPYTMGCFAVAGRVFAWGKECELSRTDFVWLFEKGDADQHDLRKHWEEAYPGSQDSIFLKKCDAYPDLSISKRQRPFEAADFVAYENLKAHKLLEERGDEPVYEEDLRKPLQRMKGWPGALDWGHFGREGIIRVCEKYGIPLR
jgi:hypothetical protein